MSQRRDSMSRIAGEALERFRLTRPDSAGLAVYCDAGEIPEGPAQDYTASGDPVWLPFLRAMVGTTKVVAADSFAFLAPLYSAADGKVSDTISGCQVGIAMELAGAAGDIIEMLPAVVGNKIAVGAYGSGQTPLTGADPDFVLQGHGKIATDVASGWYCGTFGSIELACTQTHNTSVFGSMGELDLYAAAATTLAQGNYAGVFGDLETSGTITFSSVYCWAAGIAGNVMGPGTAGTIASDSIVAAVLANVEFAAAPTYTDSKSILAGVAVRAGRYGHGGSGGIAIPYGIFIDADAATCDIRLSHEDLRVYSKASTPHGNLTAPKGSLCLVSNGSSTSTRMFINTDGGTSWTAVTTAA